MRSREPGNSSEARESDRPTGDRSRPPSALGCRSDPGIQDADGASPRMGRRPQLRLVKVKRGPTCQ